MLNGVFMHKRPNKLKFLTEKNDKVFFASVQGQSNSQGNKSSFPMLENCENFQNSSKIVVYFMTLNNPGTNRFN